MISSICSPDLTIDELSTAIVMLRGKPVKGMKIKWFPEYNWGSESSIFPCLVPNAERIHVYSESEFRCSLRFQDVVSSKGLAAAQKKMASLLGAVKNTDAIICAIPHGHRTACRVFVRGERLTLDLTSSDQFSTLVGRFPKTLLQKAGYEIKKQDGQPRVFKDGYEEDDIEVEMANLQSAFKLQEKLTDGVADEIGFSLVIDLLPGEIDMSNISTETRGFAIDCANPTTAIREWFTNGGEIPTGRLLLGNVPLRKPIEIGGGVDVVSVLVDNTSTHRRFVLATEDQYASDLVRVGDLLAKKIGFEFGEFEA